MNTKRLLLLLSIFFNAWFVFAQNEATQLSLDGNWEIIFDSKNEGQEAKWQLDKNFSQHSEIRKIVVPSCWEEYEKDYEGVAFYRKKFQISSNWLGKIVDLKFDASNYKTEVWINDVAVGVHEGGFTPFVFRIDELLKYDAENIGDYGASFFDICLISVFENKDTFWNYTKYPKHDEVVAYIQSVQEAEEIVDFEC